MTTHTAANIPCVMQIYITRELSHRYSHKKCSEIYLHHAMQIQGLGKNFGGMHIAPLKTDDGGFFKAMGDLLRQWAISKCNGGFRGINWHLHLTF